MDIVKDFELPEGLHFDGPISLFGSLNNPDRVSAQKLYNLHKKETSVFNPYYMERNPLTESTFKSVKVLMLKDQSNKVHAYLFYNNNEIIMIAAVPPSMMESYGDTLVDEYMRRLYYSGHEAAFVKIFSQRSRFFYRNLGFRALPRSNEFIYVKYVTPPDTRRIRGRHQ